ncbi:MAG: phosphomannomutase [Gammaproteobacteria bacterium]|nr:phosphomannomutase [Gammaproteobacteria bacterium]MBQ0839762.1 phosphomannomutase [Gammaproteobacteria bacterium]
MSESYSCFKAYDIRGRVPGELNEGIAYRIGRAFAQYLNASRIVVGHDIRLTSPSLCDAVVEGIRDAGCDVVHIGECGTEEIYFATFNGGYDGGLVVTASHNPMDFNGMKFVREGARPISGDAGLPEIKALAEQGAFPTPQCRGELSHSADKSAYIAHLLSYVDVNLLKPLKIVVNAGNGGAGSVVDLLEPHLPFEFIKVHHQPDGHFPNGIPNPLLEENRAATADVVKREKADLGIAWDGDFDRCFFFDSLGNFVEGYYLVGLLSSAFLKKNGGGKVIHDPRLTWNTIELAEECGGQAIQSKTGHSFIKQVMRDENALYGGEMSAHHYFRDFAYCDSGMIPWLLVAELVCTSGSTLLELMEARQARYPVSGEINREVDDAAAMLARIEAHYAASAEQVDKTDGVSMTFADWRFNVRMSNTEPLVRLNVETRGDEALMVQKTAELMAFLDA